MDDNARGKHPKRKSKLLLIIDLTLGILVVGWIVSEVRWGTISCPTGKFVNVEEYLSTGRTPSRVSTVRIDDETYWIAFSSMDSWLALPSSAPAYVFDPSGQLVDWSPDTGDSPKFHTKWLNAREKSSTEELKKLGEL